MRQVLVVTSVFPPVAHSGVHRLAKFLKHLPRLGWRPVVLHVPVRREPPARDEGLLRDVPADLVKRTLRPGPLNAPLRAAERLLGRPALGAEWEQYRRALRAGVALARAQETAAIFVTVPPKRLPTLALWLARSTGLPLVTDFRDPPWVLETNWRPRRSQQRFFEANAREVFSRSARLIANTDPVRAELVSRGHVPPERVVTIPNGFDEEDFASLPAARARSDGEFRIVCAGAPLPGEEIRVLARAFDLLGSQAEFRAAARLVILGDPKPGVRRALETSALADRIELLGHVSHERSVAEMADADLNLVFIPTRYCRLRVSQKVYPCLRAGRPILGVLADGPARRLIEESGLGGGCDPDDPTAIAGALREGLCRWRAGSRPDPPDATRLERFERGHLARALADVFDAVVKP